MGSTRLKGISQNGNFPQGSGWKFKKIFETTTQYIVFGVLVHGRTTRLPQTPRLKRVQKPVVSHGLCVMLQSQRNGTPGTDTINHQPTAVTKLPKWSRCFFVLVMTWNWLEGQCRKLVTFISLKDLTSFSTITVLHQQILSNMLDNLPMRVFVGTSIHLKFGYTWKSRS